MAEPPAPRSLLTALGDSLAAGSAGAADGVALAEREPRARFELRLDPAADGAVDAARAALGVAPPRAPNTAVTANGVTVLWLGPDQWLVTAPACAGETVERALRAALDGWRHALTDVGAMYTVLALSGARAREVLMKGCRLDLHPRSFGPGACAQTTLARAQAILHQTDDRPTYEIAVRNSFAVYLATWLLDAMAEYRSGGLGT